MRNRIGNHKARRSGVHQTEGEEEQQGSRKTDHTLSVAAPAAVDKGVAQGPEVTRIRPNETAAPFGEIGEKKPASLHKDRVMRAELSKDLERCKMKTSDATGPELPLVASCSIVAGTAPAIR